MKSAVLAATLSLLALSAHQAVAQSGHSGHHHHAPAAAQPAAGAASLAEGTVRKVDRAGGKLTIAHGPLESLGMPPMTMVFRVSDPALLEQVQTGDKIRFAAARVQGAFTVTELEAVR